jgi:alpha-L-rhamnosidase
MKLNFIISLLLLSIPLSAQYLQTNQLKVDYKTNPVIDTPSPTFSWQLKVGPQDQNILQTAYHIQVASSPEDLIKGRQLFWDSGRVPSDQSVHVPYTGPQLHSRQRLYWRVKVWDNQTRESPWSDVQHWEMGLLAPSDWTAQWISPPWEEAEKELNPPAMFRTTFSLNKKIKKARLYLTAHGIYEAYLNGQKVSDELFRPGWTSYPHRLEYQTYNVTDLLTAGNNAAGIYLGDGWYRGNFGFGHNWNPYGTKTALLFQLEIEYQNGRKETIVSDDSWTATTGPIRMSSFYHGETYDARMEMPGWNTVNFEEKNWQKVKVVDRPKDQLICPETEPVRKIQELIPDSIFQTPKGETVVDFGQNMVGWIKIKVRGNRGDTVLLRHAEVLDQEGNFYLDNIRSARQEITYILKGKGEEVFEPHFTFQGFRYVRVDKFPGEIKADKLTAVVLHTDLEKTGSFECSNPLVNQLQHNIVWGQKGNYLEIPTDCPQRDERMGWTGDVQVFAPTGCFNYDSYTFLSKWLKDLKADQLDNGSVPYVIPDIHYKNGSTGWGDAATIVPWTLYLKYGDKGILERQYDSMKEWVDYLKNLAGDNFLVQDGHHFGDWMYFVHPLNNEPKPGHTDVDLIATAYYARSAFLTAKTAEVLNHSDDQKGYEALFEKIKTAFQYEFVTPSGRLSPNSQTAYVLALAFGLLEEEKIPRAVAYLVENIKKRDDHLSTGFLGTPLLCNVLSEYGHTDMAYQLLLQESFPSWLYQVKRGATTMWERWDGIEPDGSFQEVYANSFNHFAKGAVGDWMYSVVGGIRHDTESPGYKHIIIKPEPSSALEYAKAELASPYGMIQSYWKIEGGSITLEVSIPPNTTASVFLPGHPEKKEGMQLGSGGYRFHYQWSEE